MTTRIFDSKSKIEISLNLIIAQQIVISYLDNMIEIFEALVNILEAEEINPDLDVDKVKESKKIAENRVKNLIKTLDSVTRPDSGKINFY